MAIAEGVQGNDWSESSVKQNAPQSSGVYGIYNRAWVYIGESNDIQHSLLEHWSGGHTCITSAVPTGFVFELCDLAERQRRCVTLVGRFRPRCNQGAATTGLRMRQRLLISLALTLQAVAQTLAGLPQYGVSLSGTVQMPQLNNESGKPVIGYVLRLLDRSGRATVVEEMLFTRREGSDSLPDGKSLSIHPSVRPGEPVMRVELDAVIFSDGIVSGPDLAGSFEPLGRHMLTVSQAAKEFVNAQARTIDWNAVHKVADWRPSQGLPDQNITPEEREDHYMRWVVAGDLVNEKILHGDGVAAINRAIRYMNLPVLVKK